MMNFQHHPLWITSQATIESFAINHLGVLRLVTVVVTLAMSAFFGGAGFALELLHVDHHAAKPNTSLFLAMTGAMPQFNADTSESASDTAVKAALVSRDVDQLKSTQVQDDADRKLLHDQIYRLETENTNRFNVITNRMDIADAKFNWIVALGGGMLTLISSAGTIITILDQLKRRKESTTP